MANLLTALTTPLPTALAAGPATVHIKLESPLPPSALQSTLPTPAPSPTPTQPSTTPPPAPLPALTLTVLTTAPGGQTTLQLPTGETVQAQILPPPPTGSQLTIPPAQLARLAASAPSPSPAEQPATTPSTPILTARLTPPPAAPTLTPPSPAGNLLSPSPSQPSSVTIHPTNLPLPSPALSSTKTSPTTAKTTQNPLPQATPQAENTPKIPSTPSQPTFPGTSNQLTQAIKQLNIANILANTQTSLPAGPLNLSLKTPLPEPHLATPTTLTLTTPTAGTLTTPGQPPLPVQLTGPTPLPTRTPIPLVFVQNTATPNAQPLALLTAPLATMAPHPAPTQPFTPPPLSALKVLLGQTTAPPPLNTPLTARVTSAIPTTNTAFSGQNLRIATGHDAVLQSPQPIPEGSTLVVEFPTLAGVAQVQRVQPAGQQSSAQPQLQGQTAAPATPLAPAPETPTLPAGLIIAGTATTGAQGQPMLTVTQPAAHAGQTIPLQLADTLQTHIPPGSKLSLKVEGAGQPLSLLALALPPEAERTQTLTTLASKWDTLQQGLALLSAQSPSLAQSLRANLPQLAALLPGLITFTEALRRKDADLAFGKQATTTLRAMGVDLSSDIQHLSNLQQPQADNAWRGTLFPYVEATGQDPRQGGFFWRREKKDDPRAPTNTRFIMQLSLTNIGPLQLDGLVSYPNLWLKLRRSTPAEPGFIEGLQTLVTSTLEAYGLTGGIAVEVASSFPVDPLAEMLSTTPNPLPTTA